MKSGYHQVEFEESHEQRIAFIAFKVGPLLFYEFNRISFGLVNSPTTYQRLVEKVLGELHLDLCFIYLHNLIVFPKTYEEHLDRIKIVQQRLW